MERCLQNVQIGPNLRLSKPLLKHFFVWRQLVCDYIYCISLVEITPDGGSPEVHRKEFFKTQYKKRNLKLRIIKKRLLLKKKLFLKLMCLVVLFISVFQQERRGLGVL